MDIKEINNKEIWENFLEQCQEKTFLDSWNWGEFNQKMGFNIWRLGAYENGELLGVALAIKISARRGTFLFAPHAPAVALAKEGAPAIKYEILKTLLVELKRIAKQEKAAFIRIAPIWPARIGYAEGVAGGQRNEEIFKELKFRQAPIHMHPELTWELDITKSEEELLADMRKTTRY
jgi:lipid II:glycine glycyltransferase (peptidoglycan interpeptide bridge formation enzyme)